MKEMRVIIREKCMKKREINENEMCENNVYEKCRKNV